MFNYQRIDHSHGTQGSSEQLRVQPKPPATGSSSTSPGHILIHNAAPACPLRKRMKKALAADEETQAAGSIYEPNRSGPLVIRLTRKLSSIFIQLLVGGLNLENYESQLG